MLLVQARARVGVPNVADEADIVVSSGGNLQTALNDAEPGNIIEVEANAIFTGQFTLPEKTNPGLLYITVRSSAYASLPAGRLDPVASGALLPKVKSSVANGRIISVATRGSHWRFIGIEITPSAGVFKTSLVGPENLETVLGDIPHHIEFDRCYLHGDSTAGTRRGVQLDFAYGVVQYCYISDCKEHGSDTQAVWACNSPGPLTVDDNYLEAGGENFFLGGSDPQIEDMVPSDVTVTQNTITKPDAWNPQHPDFGATDADALTTAGPNTLSSTGTTVTSTAHAVTSDYYVKLTSGAEAGQIRKVASVTNANVFVLASAFTVNQSSVTWKGLRPWSVKNLVELKIGRNVVIDGNIIDNCWAESQSGTAVLFKTENQENTADWSETGPVTFSNNIISRSPAGMSISGLAGGNPGVVAHHITVENNLFREMGYQYGGAGANTWAVLLGAGAEDITLDHNVFFCEAADGQALSLDSADPNLVRLIVRNNIFKKGAFGVKGSGTAAGTASLQGHAAGYTFSKNVLADDGADVTNYPANNYDEADFETLFEDYPDDCNLAGGSPYIDLGTDGEDIGLDWAALQAAL